MEAGDDAVEATGGHDMVTAFEGGDLGGEFLLFFSLWADGDEVKQHEHQNHRQEHLEPAALGLSGSCGLSEEKDRWGHGGVGVEMVFVFVRADW